MSFYTDIILLARHDDDVSIEGINTWLAFRTHQPLTDIGNAADVLGVHAGSFKNIDFQEFLDLFLNMPWKARTTVQLLAKPENDATFTLYAFSEPARVKIGWTPYLQQLEPESKAYALKYDVLD